MIAPTPMIRDWTYRPSKPTAIVRLLRLRSGAKGWRPPPDWRAHRPVAPAVRWNALFLYAPEGHLTGAQKDSFARIQDLRGRCAVVVATPSPNDSAIEELGRANALYWKALSGFDFSAYAIMLQEIAERSPGADLYLQNDSVLGPFGDIDDLIDAAPWRLTGFLGSSALENHLQSYALVFREIEPDLVECLRPVMSIRRALDSWRDVVLRQETRLARVAWQSGCSVGALWFAPRAHEAEARLIGVATAKAGLTKQPVTEVRDPSLCNAAELVESGFPFLKRSLLGRNERFQERRRLEAFLDRTGLSAGALV